jgi:hypothetical protein
MVAPVPAQTSKLPRRKLSSPSRLSTPNSCRLILLQTLLHSQTRQPLSNQVNPNSFAKTPGVGVPLRQLSALRVSALSFSAAFARPSRRFSCSPLTTFRMNTCKSVSKQSTLTIFRMNTYAKQGGRGGYPAKPCLVTRSQTRTESCDAWNGLPAKGRAFGKHFQGLPRISRQVPAGNAPASLASSKARSGKEKFHHERSSLAIH